MASAILNKRAAVVVQTLPGWLDHIVDAWRGALGFPVEEDYGLNADLPWEEFTSEDDLFGSRERSSNLRVATARGTGRAIIGFSADPKRGLPSNLLVIAEHTVVIDDIDHMFLQGVAERLTDTLPSYQLPRELCFEIGPGDIDLAQRPDQSADDYLKELERILRARKRSRSTADEEDELPDQALPDPAGVAAKLLLRAAMDGVSGLADAVGKGGCAVIIEVPDRSWVSYVASAWRAAFPTKARPVDGDGRQNGPTFTAAAGRHVEFRRSGLGQRDKSTVGNESVVGALMAGAVVIGISPSPSQYLPTDLVRAADVRLKIPLLDPSAIGQIATQLTGGELTVSLDDNLCRLLSADDLKLAWRRGETADAYAQRLARLRSDSSTKRQMTLEELHGMADAVRWGKTLAEDMQRYRRGELRWSDVDRGILLYGPPGTGKTSFGRALAATCGIPFLSGSLGQWQAAGHLGDLLKAMRGAFQRARSIAPCIFLIDEVDSFGDRGQFVGDNKDYGT